MRLKRFVLGSNRLTLKIKKEEKHRGVVLELAAGEDVKWISIVGRDYWVEVGGTTGEPSTEPTNIPI